MSIWADGSAGRPNRFDTGVVWTGIVAHDGNAEIWNFELAEPIVMPTATLPSIAHTPTADLVQVKTQAKGDKKKGEGGAA
jgi:hypothetical protein